MADLFADIPSADEILLKPKTESAPVSGNGNLFADIPSADAASQPVTKPDTGKFAKFDNVDSFVVSLMNGLTANFGAELAGVIGGVIEGLGRDEGFNAARERIAGNSETMLREAAEDNPIAATAGEATGLIASSLVPAGNAIKAAQGANKLRNAAAVGAGTGAVFGAGEEGDLKERVESAGKGALTGALAGAASVPVAKLAGAATNKVLSKIVGSKVPTVDAIKKEAGKFYAVSDKSTQRIEPLAIQVLIDDMTELAARGNAVRGLTPKAKTALNNFRAEAKRLIKDGKRITPRDVHTLRKFFSKEVRGKNVDADIRGVAMMKEAFDKRMSRLVQGYDDPSGPFQARIRGDALNAQAETLNLIEPILAKAAIRRNKDGIAGAETFVRNELEKLVTNKKAFNRFTPEQQDAIRLAVEGSAGQRASQGLGKLFQGVGFPFSLIAPVLRGPARRLQVNRAKKAHQSVAGFKPAGQKSSRAVERGVQRSITSGGIVAAN